MAENMIGLVQSKDRLFLRMSVGTATLGEGKYEMSTNIGDSSPMIRSQKTGKWWSITWNQLLDLAIKAGIDNEAEEIASGEEKTTDPR